MSIDSELKLINKKLEKESKIYQTILEEQKIRQKEKEEFPSDVCLEEHLKTVQRNLQFLTEVLEVFDTYKPYFLTPSIKNEFEYYLKYFSLRQKRLYEILKMGRVG